MKNKLIKARREQLEKYAKPDKKAALKQFAVNHELNDAKDEDSAPSLVKRVSVRECIAFFEFSFGASQMHG